MLRRVRLLLGLLTLGAARRPAALALAALLAIGIFSAGNPLPARADPLAEFPVLTVDPTCEPLPQNSDGDTITLTVRGFSFEMGRTVMVYFNGNQIPGAEAVVPGPAGAFEIPVTVTEVGSTPSYQIAAYYTDLGVTDNAIASAYLSVPCDDSRGPHQHHARLRSAANTPIAMHVDLSGFRPESPITVQVLRPVQQRDRLRPGRPDRAR